MFSHKLLLSHAWWHSVFFHLQSLYGRAGHILSTLFSSCEMCSMLTCRAANLRPHLSLKGQQSGLSPMQRPKPLPTALQLQRLLLPLPLLRQQQSSSLATGWGLSVCLASWLPVFGLSVCVTKQVNINQDVVHPAVQSGQLEVGLVQQSSAVSRPIVLPSLHRLVSLSPEVCLLAAAGILACFT